MSPCAEKYLILILLIDTQHYQGHVNIFVLTTLISSILIPQNFIETFNVDKMNKIDKRKSGMKEFIIYSFTDMIIYPYR